MQINQKLSTFALTLLITGAIDSVRNLPASAFFGSQLIFFFVLAAILFLIPSALVSAELSANINEGGVYHWTRLAFGEHIGFLALWLQWINNLVWFPTILSFIAGTAAYLINPALAHHNIYMVSIIISLFWLVTLINLRGFQLSSKITSFCALIGLLIPMSVIIILLLAWLVMGFPLQIHLTTHDLLPSFTTSDHWVSLTAIMLGFAGMELASVHIKDVHQPKKTFPLALLLSTMIILTTMILGSLAVAFVVPMNQLNLVNGTMQSFAYFLSAYHLKALIPVMAILLVIGSVGGVISWVLSPIRGFAQSAQQGFMPLFLQRQNRFGMPQNLLITQAVIVSMFCLFFLLLPSINASYWFLTSLATQLYMVMYVLLFICPLKLCKHAKQDYGFTIPGGRIGRFITCILGLLGCAITITVGFIPPSNIPINHYSMMIGIGMMLLMAPAIMFSFFRIYRGVNVGWI